MTQPIDPKPTGNHVFISYARADQTYTRKLADDLHRHGFKTWLDDRIDFGDRWWRTIVKAIRHSAAVVVVMTPASEESEWVEREILLAQREQKPIFPLLLRGHEFPLLITTQYADVTNGQLPADKFYQRLSRVVPPKPKIEKSQKQHVTPPQPKPKIITPASQPFEPELILIPAGEFLMGSDPNVDKQAEKNEQPQHRLYLPDYHIAKTPVTDAQYAAFVQATGHEPPAHWENKQPPPNKQDHPAVYVRWQDAVAYCNWLTKTTARTYRLPTEAEWEKAARGPDGLIYPWGNEWDARRCNTREGGLRNTTPVGAYPDGASPYGCLDMAGNVWEWCATKEGKLYPYDISEDEWAVDYRQEGGLRVLRSGSFRSHQNDARCAYRNRGFPFNGNDLYGFRVLVSPI